MTRRRARTLDARQRVELAVVTWMLAGCGPDDALRRAQAADRHSRRDLSDVWRAITVRGPAILAEIARRIGADPDRLGGQWTVARLLHAERIREVLAEIRRRDASRDRVALPGAVTPERARHGRIREGRAVDPENEKRTVKVLVDDAGTALRAAHVRDRLTASQLAAGERLAECIWLGMASGSGRSAFVWLPRGTTETEAEWRIRAAVELRRVKGAIVAASGHDAWAIVQDVAGYDAPIGDCRPKYRRYRLLCAGLDAAAEHYERAGQIEAA
jgi:hypothetical protein